MLPNFVQGHNNVFESLRACANSIIHDDAEEENVPSYFVVPETLRLSLAQRTELTETGFNQGLPFMLSSMGMTRPDAHNTIKMRTLRSLCNIHANSVKIVSISSTSSLPPPSQLFSELQKKSILSARKEGLPEYELQFEYSAECDALLKCYFGAYVRKNLNEIKIRSDLPGSKKWESIRLPAGTQKTFCGSHYGLTFVEHDPLFYRLHRLRAKVGFTAKEILEESVRSGIYDAILSVSPLVDRPPETPRNRKMNETDNSEANEKAGAVEMSSRHPGETNTKESTDAVSAKQETSWQRAKAAMMGRAPFALRDKLHGNVVCTAEFTMCQLAELPEFQRTRVSSSFINEDQSAESVSVDRIGLKYTVSPECTTSKTNVEIRDSESTASVIPQDARKVIPQREINKNYTLKRNENTSSLKVFEDTSYLEQAKVLSFLSRMHVISQRVQWNNEYFHSHEIYGADWTLFGYESVHDGADEGRTQETAIDSDDNSDCVICLGARREIVCVPCCHMCICADCAIIMKEQQAVAINQNRDNPIVQNAEVFKCPMCRTRVSFLVHAVATEQTRSL